MLGGNGLEKKGGNRGGGGGGGQQHLDDLHIRIYHKNIFIYIYIINEP
jgi:hypothetical protein